MAAQEHSESQKRERPKSKYECTFCHDKDHREKDCPKLKRKNKSAVDACIVERDTSDSKLSLVVLPSSFHSNKWILDS